MAPTRSRAGFSLPFMSLALLALTILVWGVGWWVVALALGLALLATVVTMVRDHLVPPHHRIDPPATTTPHPEITSDDVPEHGTFFSSLEDAVRFIGECLESDDQDRLSAACSGNGTGGDPLTSLAYNWLRERHTASSLAELYGERSFPRSPGTFKLGGHDRELGHVHVDFASADGTQWWLGAIWMCR